MADYKEMHDNLITNKPGDMSQAEFDELLKAHKEDCPFCNDDITTRPEERGDNVGDNNFTQDEVDAAVEAAVAPVQAELDNINKFLAESQVDDRVAEAMAAGDERVAEVQAELDKAVAAKGAAEKQLEETLQFFAELQELAELNELYEARKSERKAHIAEAASFSDEYIEQNIDRWAALIDEDFEATVADWKAIPSKAEVTDDKDESLRSTAMQNVRPSGATSASSDLEDVLAAGKHGFNIKRLR